MGQNWQCFSAVVGFGLADAKKFQTLIGEFPRNRRSHCVRVDVERIPERNRQQTWPCDPNLLKTN